MTEVDLSRRRLLRGLVGKSEGPPSAAPAAPEPAGEGGKQEPPSVAPGEDRPIPPETVLRLGSLQTGDTVGPYTLVAIGAVRFGAIPLVFSGPDGGRFQIDLLRRGQEPSGLVDTGQLSLFLCNSGNAQTATVQQQGQVATAIARVLAEDEQAGLTLPPLLTFAERAVRHPDGAYQISV